MFKLIVFLFIISYTSSILALESKIIIASTTSTADTGLLNYLNEAFYKKYQIKVNVIAVGTGQAIKIAKDGNAEILLVHHTGSEMDFMSKGYGLVRYNLMYNDYIIIGPKYDTKTCKNFKTKLNEIFVNNLIFISRGDDSGTHKKELEIWNSINLNTKKFGTWYLNIGQGMGNALLMANHKFAYTLSDRGTWISFNKRNNLKIICEKFPPLLNQYGLIISNPENNPDLDIKSAKIYSNWLISDEGKKLINNFKIKGEQLFFYNHH
jgi:tungstate transport system substrate-binding protein